MLKLFLFMLALPVASILVAAVAGVLLWRPVP